MKHSERVRTTRQQVEEAFLGLMKQRPVSRITVRELCERAQIHRATFYAHYQDVYDLLEQLEQQGLEEIAAAASGPGELLPQLLEGMAEGTHRTAQLLASEHGSGRFAQRVTDLLFELNRPRMADRLAALPPDRQEDAYHFLAGGCGLLISQWCREGMTEPPRRLAARITALCDPCIAALAQKQEQ